MFADSYKPQINGMVKTIDSWVEGLEKLGNKVFLFVPKTPGYKYKRNVFTLPSLEFKPYPEYRLGIPNFLLNKKLKKMRIDIIHVHSPFTMGISGMIFAKFSDIPVVGTFHTNFPSYINYLKLDKIINSKNLKRYSWKYLSWFYNRCEYVTVPTKAFEKVLKNKLKTKIVVIPPGIKFVGRKKSKKKLKKKYGFDENEKIILHVGRICKEKNISFIIKAFNYLKNKNVKLVITSDGPYRENLEKKVEKLGIENKVFFTGYISENVLQDFYQLSDVFVMASNTETLGFVLLEAIYNYLPIVVTDSPVISDLVIKNRIGIVSKRNPKDFSKEIWRLLTDKRLRHKCLANRKKTIEKYDIKKCATELLKIYEAASG